MNEIMSLLHQYTPIEYLTQPNHRSYWLYLVCSVLIIVFMQWGRAVLQYVRQTTPSMNEKHGVGARIWQSLKPWWGAQARLDYRYFVVNWGIKTFCLVPLLFSVNTVATWCLNYAKPTLFEASNHWGLQQWSYEWVAIVYTLSLFFINDASRYALHRLMHSVDWLWAFHKVHHSATELTPFTFYRVHPVENFLFGVRYALVTGAVTGVFIGLFGAKLNLLDIAGVNALVYVLNIIGANLRHSSVYVRYPKWLEHVLISPAQHQLHHQYKTSMKNYGSFLAIWDAWFGSLTVSSKTNQPTRFGLSESDIPRYNSVKGLLWTPFSQLFNARVPKFLWGVFKKFMLGAMALLGLSTATVSDAGELKSAPSLTPEQALGQLLFFDKNLSKNKTQSCSTCHDPNHAFIDSRLNVTSASKDTPAAVSLGDDGVSLGVRNSPTAAYANQAPEFHKDKKTNAFVGGQFLDGRALNLAEQAGAPFLEATEMNMPSKQAVITRLRKNPMYVERFTHVYGEGSLDHTEQAYERVKKAISAFERSDFFAPFDSKYDQFLRGEYDLSVLEDLGRTLFFSNNNVSCASCHLLKKEDDAREPFTNYQYHNIGVPKNPQLAKRVPSLRNDVDHGLLDNPKVNKDKAQDGKFKVPTLRNVAVTAPYMHNGVFKDLETVVLFYDKFNNSQRKINPETQKPWASAEVPDTVDLALLKGKKMTQRKVDALLAFMKLLTDKRYEHLLEPTSEKP